MNVNFKTIWTDYELKQFVKYLLELNVNFKVTFVKQSDISIVEYYYNRELELETA